MFQINDILIFKPTREKVKLMAITYDPFTKGIKYIVDSKYEENIECTFYDLADVRYLH